MPLKIGPYKQNEIRWRRPYFVIPLLHVDPSALWTEQVSVMSETIGNYVQCARDQEQKDAAQAPETPIALPDPPVTDIYVFSHGWHRNYFAAIAAYDRLMSR